MILSEPRKYFKVLTGEGRRGLGRFRVLSSASGITGALSACWLREGGSLSRGIELSLVCKGSSEPYSTQIGLET